VTPAGVIAVIVTAGAWCAVALADRRARKRRQHVNRIAAEWRRAAAVPEPLPRRRRTVYAPAGPLTPGEADRFAALVFAYRYVDIPEPADRSGQ